MDKRSSRTSIKRRRKTRTRIAVLLVFGTILIILVASYLSRPSSPAKKPAQPYFEVIPGGFIGDLVNVTEKIWAVYEIWFNITPVGGDANNLIVKSWAMGEPQELFDVMQNQSAFVHLKAGSSVSPYLAEANKYGMIPVTIGVVSEEAEGQITIEFSPTQT